MLTSAGFRYWLQAARPVGHGMLAMPLLWGQALALLVLQEFHWSWFVAIHLYAVFVQVYILYLNDYADEAVDKLNQQGWMSGGSRVIPDGYLSGTQLYRASFLALGGMVLIAVASCAAGRPAMLALVGMAAFMGWNYSLKPLQSSYRGFGELHQSLSCGGLLPVTAFYLQSGSFAAFPWLLLIPFCLIFFAGNIITALPDTQADAEGGKKTFPVRHGSKKSTLAVVLLLALAYVSAPILSAQGLSMPLMAVLVSTPALFILLYVSRAGLVSDKLINDQSQCEMFVLLTTLSQLWMIVGWISLLFWQALQAGG